jgi:2',3'-cyclic-nucleotide 2'-phosphodiesterase (5'-nucleotidase family)
MSLPPMERIVDLQVQCAKCREPKYYPIDPEEWYRVAMPSFLSAGGDGYTPILTGRNLIVGTYMIHMYNIINKKNFIL